MSDNYNWQEDANCNGTDTEMFFTQDGSKSYNEFQLLERVCGNCGVFDECLSTALKYNVRGWWANTTEAKRERLRRKLNITPISIVKETA